MSKAYTATRGMYGEMVLHYGDAVYELWFNQ